MSHNSSDYVHTLVEAVRLALTDAMCHLADPDHMTLPVETLLDKGYSRQRGQHIQMKRSAFCACVVLVPMCTSCPLFTLQKTV